MAAWSGRCPDCGESIDLEAESCGACGADLMHEVVMLDRGSGRQTGPQLVELGRRRRRRGKRLPPIGRGEEGEDRPALDLHRAAIEATGVIDASQARLRRRRRRDGALIIALLAGLVALMVSFGAPRNAGRGEAQPADQSRGPSTSTVDRWPAGTAATTSLVKQIPMLGRPTGIRIVSQFGPTVQALDLDTGNMRVVGSGFGTLWGALALEGGLVLVAEQRVSFFAGSTLDGVPVDLGAGRLVLAAATPDRVWILHYDGHWQVRLVGLSGEVLLAPVETPADVRPVASVSQGLLFNAVDGTFLLDSRTGRFRRFLAGRSLGAQGDLVAVYRCDDDLQCGAFIVDVGTRRSRPVSATDGTSLKPNTTAVFSPDGSRLAMTVGGSSRVVVADVATGEAMAVPSDSFLGGGVLEWSPDGNWLFACSSRYQAYEVGAPAVIEMVGLGQGCRPAAVL